MPLQEWTKSRNVNGGSGGLGGKNPVNQLTALPAYSGSSNPTVYAPGIMSKYWQTGNMEDRFSPLMSNNPGYGNQLPTSQQLVNSPAERFVFNPSAPSGAGVGNFVNNPNYDPKWNYTPGYKAPPNQFQENYAKSQSHQQGWLPNHSATLQGPSSNQTNMLNFMSQVPGFSNNITQDQMGPLLQNFYKTNPSGFITWLTGLFKKLGNGS